MTRGPFSIELYPVRMQPLEPVSFEKLPRLPAVKTEEEIKEMIDPPVPLSENEERLWRRTVGDVQDRSGALYALGAILRKHGLRDDLIVTALSRHPLSIDKYLGRSMREATRIVQKLEATPEDVPVVEQMLVWDWWSFMSKQVNLSWMVKDAWIDRSVGFISGRAKSYKSWTVADMAMSVASGQKFLNHFESEVNGPVVIIQEEDPHAVIQERINLIMNSKGVGIRSRTTSYGWEIDLPGFPIVIINLQGFRLDDEEKVKQLMKLLSSVRPALLVMDPLINMLPADLDDNRGIKTASILQKIKLWREEFQCSIVVAHHWNRGNASSSNIGAERIYGSFAFHAWLESALHVRPTVEEGEIINQVIIEREFKAQGPSGETFKVEFDINTKGDFLGHHYTPNVIGNAGPKEDIYTIIKNNMGIEFGELQKKTGIQARTLQRNIDKLLETQKIEGIPTGKRGTTQFTVIEDKPKKKKIVLPKKPVES